MDSLGRLETRHNHRVLSTRSDGRDITLEVLIWTEKEAEFELRPILATCLRVASTPSTVRTSAVPCSADSRRYGKLVTAITPLTDAVHVAPAPERTPPCYSGSGRCI